MVYTIVALRYRCIFPSGHVSWLDEHGRSISMMNSTIYLLKENTVTVFCSVLWTCIVSGNETLVCVREIPPEMSGSAMSYVWFSPRHLHFHREETQLKTPWQHQLNETPRNPGREESSHSSASATKIMEIEGIPAISWVRLRYSGFMVNLWWVYGDLMVVSWCRMGPPR